jgi:hypothetical protein
MVSADAQRLLAAIRQHAPSPDRPLNMSRAAELAGISSKRRLLELVGEPNFALNARRSLFDRSVPKKFEYTVFAVLSYGFALITLLIALIRLRELTMSHLTQSAYVNYVTLALMIATIPQVIASVAERTITIGLDLAAAFR